MKFTFPPETRVLDGYTIKRAIYRGGFGEVYYALSDAGREVALKLLHNNTEIELRGVQQCLNLTHPNLVTIFDIREDGDGDHWIIMEYVGGETLDALIRRYPAGMPMEVVRRWLPGIAAGVSFLHSRGIVHRDLKPANVFSDNGIVKVGDVGLSKFITPSRRSAQTQSVGTVYYMAPEVAKGRYGKEVDVYALGIILYEMLTGHVPFNGESAGEILLKHLMEAPDLSPLPPRIRHVVGRALAKDPTQRFPTVEAFVTALDAAVIGKGVSQGPPKEPFNPRLKPGENDPPATVTGPIGGVGPVQDPAATPPAPGAEVPSPVSDDQPSSQRSSWIPSSRDWYWILGFGLLYMLFTRTSGSEALSYFLIGSGAGYLTFVMPRRLSGRLRSLAGSQSVERMAGGTAAGKPKDAMRLPHQGPGRVGTAGFRPMVLTPFAVRTRLAHWSHAAVAAVFLIAGLTAGVGLVAPSLLRVVPGEDLAPEAIALFSLTTLTGVWLISAVVKLTEHVPAGGRVEDSDEGLRRLGMAAAGILTGAAAWWLSDYLQIDPGKLYAGQDIRGFVEMIGERPLVFTTQGRSAPTLLGYVVFFGGLFGLRSWWRQIELHRVARFRAGSVLMTVVLAWLWSALFAFPVTWALLWAAVISTTVQLAAPWSPARVPPPLPRGVR